MSIVQAYKPGDLTSSACRLTVLPMPTSLEKEPTRIVAVGAGVGVGVLVDVAVGGRGVEVAVGVAVEGGSWVEVDVAGGGTVGVDIAVAGDVAVGGAVDVAVGPATVVGVGVAVDGDAKPLTRTTWLAPPNVEKRKSPVTGSITAPSAPLSPVRNAVRVAGSGSPNESS